ncbi:AGC/PKA protein kinase Pka1 [Schizosaccharomyces cryophilus OY26]|uniref:cAMP-dependent protein kinase n=1 Tax=Schizosaccharomyces cryophilus (strain OY26 / ATCC MYA-4695 / CBS 11777 / NBRC 106824 / NRRL Y48691) TaxID=653667 RepID=S9VXY1_SCHCR|nr:AGC/PKA protein kinase Pka1 [Schizosaccharomyces cryophilus OY26]EPY51074.1 AGC/PKA protein kinase Pka1 [Schizosaccharomyces cryophilus OY26]
MQTAAYPASSTDQTSKVDGYMDRQPDGTPKSPPQEQKNNGSEQEEQKSVEKTNSSSNVYSSGIPAALDEATMSQPAPSASEGPQVESMQSMQEAGSAEQQQPSFSTDKPAPSSSEASSRSTETQQYRNTGRSADNFRDRQLRKARLVQLLDLQRKRIRPADHTTKGRYGIQDFDCLQTLGTGSFGRVHLVQSKHNRLFYAIKVLEKRKVVDMKQVEHTCDERHILSRVQHPFITILWGTFQDAKNLFMVMDFAEGGELFSLLRKCHRFPEKVAKFYAAEVILALDYLHHNQIVYRDLKPENLLLDRFGHLKIVDFGFAKRVSTNNCFTLCGTPDYLAPEIISLKPYNKAADWWSLGIFIFEMLAGYPPFYSENPMKLYENILEGNISYPQYFSSSSIDLMNHLLQRDITNRYGNLKDGSMDIIMHPWFRDISWDKILTRKIEVPYVPPIRAGMGDSSQFEAYATGPTNYGGTENPEFTDIFQDF